MNSIKDIDIWLQMNYWAFIRGLWCCDGLRGGIFGRSLWSRQKHRTFHWNPKGSTGRRAWVHLCKWWWNLSVQWKGSWAKGQIDALSFLRRSSKHTHTYIYIYTHTDIIAMYMYIIYTHTYEMFHEILNFLEVTPTESNLTLTPFVKFRCRTLTSYYII
jgi:hypothetical protein